MPWPLLIKSLAYIKLTFASPFLTQEDVTTSWVDHRQAQRERDLLYKPTTNWLKVRLENPTVAFPSPHVIRHMLLCCTLPVLCWMLPAVCCTLPVLCYTLPVLYCTLPVLCCTLLVLCWTLPVLCWTLPVRCCTLLVLCWTLPVLCWTLPVRCCESE